jgi:hypothetical protein
LNDFSSISNHLDPRSSIFVLKEAHDTISSRDRRGRDRMLVGFSLTWRNEECFLLYNCWYLNLCHMPQTNMFSFILILNWYLVVYCLFMVFNATFQQYFSNFKEKHKYHKIWRFFIFSPIFILKNLISLYHKNMIDWFIYWLVLNATSRNISLISWRS